MSESALSIRERFDPSRFFRGEKPVSTPVILNHRRIFILPTQRGLGMAVLILLLLLIAFVYNNNLAYMLTFLLASVFFITILHSYNALAGLVIVHGMARSAFLGEAVGFDFLVHNPLQRSRHNIQLKMETRRSLYLSANEKKTVTLYVNSRKRGLQSCGTITVSSRYPLGLFRVWSPLRFDVQAVVYPRPSHIERPFPESEGVQGEQGQGKKGGDEYYGLKTYQSGDSVRQIHWQSLAKGQGLKTKQYAGTAVSDLWLDYGETAGQQTEERLSQLCRWVIDAEKAGLHYGLILPGVKITCDRGDHHFHQCLQALALF